MAEQPVRARIVVTGEDGVPAPPRVVTLPVDLGHDPEHADVAIADRLVADRHARLETDGDGLAVVDLESGHGTWVGEEQVTRRALGGDDVVVLGSSTVACSIVPPPPRPGRKPTPPTRPTPPARAAATFGTAWAVAFDDGKLTPIPLRGLYTAWGQTTRSAAALGSLLAAEPAGPVARLDAHDALDAVLDTFLGGDFRRLGNLTIAFCQPDRPVDVVSRHVLRLRSLPAYRKTRVASADLRAEVERADGDAEDMDRVTGLLAVEDRRFLVRTVTAMRQGAAAFQRHGVAVVDRAGDELLDHLKTVLGAAALRDVRVMAHLRLAGLIPDDPADAAGPDAGDLS